MNFYFRNKANFLVYLTLCISKCESLIVTDEKDQSHANNYENESKVVIDSNTKFKWIQSGDMVEKIAVQRRLDITNDEMSDYEDKFYHKDVNDIMQPSSVSGQDSFWELFGQLDKGKKPPLYEKNGSKPVLSKFRYIIVPIWWQDEDTTDPEKIIKTDAINKVMAYNQAYYKRMSFGKFAFLNHIILPQGKISVSSQNPGWGDLEPAARARATDAGYSADTDYNGLIILYNNAKEGPFSGSGGWGTVNSNLSVTWMSWPWGLGDDVARHEFGHNFGHPHHLSNGYKYRFGKEGVVGYDGYDMMSGGNGYDISDFALASKWFFGWVPDSAIIHMQPQGSTSSCPNCVSERTVTLYPLDGNDATKRLGVHIPVTSRGNTLYSYWLSYRSGNPATVGLSVHLSWFSNIGTGQFGAWYDSLNYDAHGDTITTADSFVLPGTCYHIAPSVKMLEIDPVASMATQPVVCVSQLSQGESIKIQVSFTKNTVPTKDKIVMQCGNSRVIDVESNKNQLVHIDNIGVNGMLTLNGSSSSTAKVYIYDRYPMSPLKYSAPGAYGSFASMTMPSESKLFTNAGLCMQSSLNPLNVFMKECTGGNNQNWTFDKKTKLIKNEESGQCLDVDLGDGDNIITWGCHGASNQQWERDDVNKSFKSLANQKCMTVEDNKNIRLFPCKTGKEQEFSRGNLPIVTKEYRAIHNEAWLLISAQSQAAITASCAVNECQFGQKKEGKKCVPCKSTDTSCKKCPAGLEFLISTCVLSETVKTISSSMKWRIWAPKYHTKRGWVWDINDIKFYNSPDCEGPFHNDGTAIDSGNAGGGWGPANAFDSSDGSAWGGREDSDGLFWIGMDFDAVKNVGCVSILDNENNGVIELRVQAWESSTSTWQNVHIAKNYVSGTRQNISLKGPVTCKDLGKVQCREQKEVCKFDKRKKIFTDCKPGKNKKYRHDCKKYTSRKKCIAVKGLCKFKNGTCSHVCDGLAKKACKSKRFPDDNKKMCRMPKIQNPCFGCHQRGKC